MGWDWTNNWILKTIQYWEQFYINWIRNGKKILVIYSENFEDGLFKNTLKKITDFLNFDWNEQRLNCVLKRKKDRFHQRKPSFTKGHSHTNFTAFIASKINYCATNETYTWNIYSKKHFIWINSAIRKVKHELKKRGLDSSYIFH